MHKGQKNYFSKHYPSIRKHFWSMISWTWSSFSTLGDPRFSPTKDEHSKLSDKYASLQLHADIDSVAVFSLFRFSSVACYWAPTRPTLFVFAFVWLVDSNLYLNQNYWRTGLLTRTFEHVHKSTTDFLVASTDSQKSHQGVFFLVEIRSCCANRIRMYCYKL